MLENPAQQYGGKRILEAMHDAVRYSDAIFAELLAAMPAKPGPILDFGAGDGAFLDRLGKRGLAVDCLEPDQDLRAQLQSRAQTVYSDLSEIPDGRFGFVYTVNVLEHIAEIDRTCSELSRVMRPGGTIFVFVPAHRILWTSLDDEVGHVRRFSRSSLSGVLANAGFIVDDLKFFDSIGFAAALYVRISEKMGLFNYKAENVRLYDQYVFPASRRLDGALSRVIGKNLVAIARKPGATSGS